jgi:hypothetical protein
MNCTHAYGWLERGIEAFMIMHGRLGCFTIEKKY